MGACGGRSAVVVINSKMNPKIERPKYEPIPMNLTTLDKEHNILSSIDIDYCVKFNIGPFFLSKHPSSIFSQVFKKEVKDSYDSLVLYTQYDSIITKQTISEKNINEIKQFVQSNNITNINSLSNDDIKNHLLYCSNMIFRMGLYNKVLSEIELSDSFKIDHPDNNEHSVSDSNESYIAKAKRQIFLDINRTYPKLELSVDKAYCTNFYSILYEIALRNENITYTQGMNFICGFLLMLTGNSKEDAFYFFCKLFSLKSKKFNVCFEQCFFLGFDLLNKYIGLFNQLLQEQHKDIYDTIVSLGVVSELWFGKWIMLLFVTNFDFEMCLKFWDIILAYGLDYAVLISIDVCEVLKERILKCESIDQFNKVIHNGNVKMSPKEKGELFKLIYSDIKSNKYNL